VAVVAQLEQTQWWSPEQLRAHQLHQASALLRHARDTTPWYAERLAGLALDPLDEEGWQRVPVVGRRTIRTRGHEMLSRALPKAHGAPQEISTSGSTGTPITVKRTPLFGLFWNAMTVREILWHRKDVSARLAIIRHSAKEITPPGMRGRGWGSWAAAVGPPGDVFTLGIRTLVDAQLGWLQEVDPAYLLTYPTNLAHLVELAARRGVRLPALRSVTTLSEVLRPDLRVRTREVLGVPIQDLYSTQEAGYLGIQCPEHEQYHVPAEDVIVEVLDEAGHSCAPGEVGRIVVTSLHNFAMPLIRYEVGDFGVFGEPCPCGRGLPVLLQVMGRVRNSLLTADGRRLWVNFGVSALAGRLPQILQQQFVQTTFDTVEARVVLSAPLSDADERHLVAHLQERLPDGFRVLVRQVGDLPRSAGGKFEDFLCLVDAPEAR